MEEKLKKLIINAYAPYSNYKVGAILKTKDDKEFIGVNVENASYGATICAERNAINEAIANGYKKDDFAALYIMANSNKIAMPCMLCRQTFTELLDEQLVVTLYNNEGESKQVLVKELCPFPFSEENL